MKKVMFLALICILSGLLLIACQRDRGVLAGNESDTYQPRPAKVKAEAKNPLQGDLLRVDMAGKTISVRVENGMEQTFKFDDNTTVMGLEGQPQTAPPAKITSKTSNSAIRNLAGKEGSEVSVTWRDDDGARMATAIDVTQVSIAKKPRPTSRRK
jgi:hypothetical protein